MSLILSPSEIRYSQDSILYKFSDGNRLTSTFARLISGQLSVNELPTIECAQKDGNWYATSGNRRLLLYKKLQEAGVISTITVSRYGVIGAKNFTTKCSGVYVRFRGPSFEYSINEIISQWKRGENVVSKWGTAPVSPVTPRRGRNRRYDDSDDDDSDSYNPHDNFFCGDDYNRLRLRL